MEIQITYVLILNRVGFSYVINSGKAMAPQISGNFTPGQGDNEGAAGFATGHDSHSGAFYPGTAKSIYVLKETDGKWTGAPLGFQASRSNSIYGAGSTIRPVNRSTRFMIKY